MASIGTLMVFIGFPLWLTSVATDTGIKVRHGITSTVVKAAEVVETFSLRVSLWVARKAEEVFDDMEMGHLMFDVVHHTLLTGSGHH